MNIKEFDWHQKGIWAACAPDGTPLRQTFSDTPYGARVELLRGENLRGKGYTIRGFEETQKVHI